MLPPNKPGCLSRTINTHIGVPLVEQMMGMQAAHHPFVAIQEVLAVGVQFLEAAVDRVERQRLDFDAFQGQGHLRKYLEEVYGKVFRRYMLLVNEAAPKLPPIELFWRVHFMLGAAAFSMSGIKALRAMAETDFGVNTSTEQVMHLMVPFFAAGMRAESGIDDPLLAGAQLRPRNKTPAKA